MSIENKPELARDKYTEYLYNEICFGEPLNAESAEDVINGIEKARKLENQSVFLEGLSARLNQLGISCTPKDTEIMLAEVKKRYKTLLGKNCPRTVQEWCRETVPSVTNRQNNYELCYALEMDFQQTSVFFQKNYLTLPFIVKSKTDAVFMYCLYYKKPYSAVIELLERSKGFVSQKNAHTSTNQIRMAILETDDDEKFLRYLSEHCYDNEQQFQVAREIIKSEIEIIKDEIMAKSFSVKKSRAEIEEDKKEGIYYKNDPPILRNRLGSLTIENLLGYNYQNKNDRIRNTELPKRFTESLPNDVTLGKILNDGVASYDLLRKTLMLVKFYNFYSQAENSDCYTIGGNLMDFYEELDAVLDSCGFAQIYLRHPFDCLLMYCANSNYPVDTLHCVIENGRN